MLLASMRWRHLLRLGAKAQGSGGASEGVGALLILEVILCSGGGTGYESSSIGCQ